MPFEHLHPIVVHFPLVLLLQATVIDAVLAARGGNLSGPGPSRSRDGSRSTWERWQLW